MQQMLREQLEELKEKAQPLLQAESRTILASEVSKIESLSLQENFWQREDAQELMQKMSEVREQLGQYQLIETLLDDAETIALLDEEATLDQQEELAQQLQSTLKKLQKAVENLELKTFLSGRFDAFGAILSIHSGQGGTEAMDWAEMLKRMYTRYFERNGWKYTLVSESRGEEAGIKAVEFEIPARHAYGYLRREGGTHRLVRLSPFNADSLRQTSFALVEIFPLVDTDLPDIQVKDEDLEWKFSRAGGAGGQNVNKVNSAVELHHIPSDITVRCREERSQAQNKERAFKKLKSLLAIREEEKREAEIQKEKGVHTNASWGSQIRNYVLHPYQLVKDTRTGVETSDTTAVLDGDLDEFIRAEIQL
ncbi:MAG: peptide chain release factor 2 [Microgenomates group bacterium]